MAKTPIAVSLMVIVVLLGVVAIGAIAAGDDSSPPSEGHSQVEEVEPAAMDALAVLRDERDAGDGLPHEVADKMNEHAPFGMNPDLSRRSIGNATNSVYVIPAADHVCVSLTVGDGANLICPSTGEVADGRTAGATVVIDTGDIAVYGVVPDGVTTVALRTGASDSTDVSVQGNTYYTVVPAGTPVRSVAYSGPSGAVAFPIQDPTLAMEDE